MKPMDYHQFEKWIRSLGYRIAHSAKYHRLIDADGNTIVRFAISHKKGGKQFIKSHYIKEIIQEIGG